MGANDFDANADRLKGKVNETVGDMRDDPGQELKGKAQQMKGDVEAEMADMKDDDDLENR
jgi:uncharacterized protein YjbJ (UPF0337 family)